MIGLDVVELDRFAAVLERRPGLAARLFTPDERAYAAARPRPVQHLAARFCAKEAIVKALRPPQWDYQDIAVLPEARARLTGPLAGRHVEISLTHGESIAAAVAVASPR